ncbi:hypothetical protein [Actinophytocola xanthii]|uniref:Uncharacterized protein n=1 Tax=Actinophytocola xanthii TaxID=1912961 RepID=A0A1Q8BWW6_9PSEU|nr:hypothetical protein [Actinophytocola xanthii]OLF06594.1 hypothetical protein BU204_36275 [Actinophytocola xanthii]
MTMSDMLRRLCVVLTVVATAAMGTAGQAAAAPTTEADRVAVAAPAPVPVPVEPGLALTFDRATTERIYTVASGAGLVGLSALCVSVVSGWLMALGCVVFASVVMRFILARPPRGRCLQAFTQWVWPPIGVRYVTC